MCLAFICTDTHTCISKKRMLYCCFQLRQRKKKTEVTLRGINICYKLINITGLKWLLFSDFCFRLRGRSASEQVSPYRWWHFMTHSLTGLRGSVENEKTENRYVKCPVHFFRWNSCHSLRNEQKLLTNRIAGKQMNIKKIKLFRINHSFSWYKQNLSLVRPTCFNSTQILRCAE